MHHAGRWKRETEIWLNESTTKDLLIGRYKGTERQEHLENGKQAFFYIGKERKDIHKHFKHWKANEGKGKGMKRYQEKGKSLGIYLDTWHRSID